jgi:outer membrane lipoprotein carrier protein
MIATTIFFGIWMQKKAKILIYLFSIAAMGFVASAKMVIPASFSARFVQKITTADKKQKRYTGKAYINRSREFKWLYTAPGRREICGDGSKVRIINHDLEQVTVYKVGSLLDLMQLIKRAKPYRGDIYLTRYHGVRYTLKVNKAGQMEQIAYRDKMDNVVNIHFYNIQYNKTPFAVSRLRCPIPKTYDVIKG